MKTLKYSSSILFIIFLIFSSPGNIFSTDGPDKSFLTSLRSRGYSLIPYPQYVELGDRDIVIDNSWMLQFNFAKDDIAVKRLTEGAEELHNLKFASRGRKKIILSVIPGIVKESEDSLLNEQGYLLKITPDVVEISANNETGIFYGVQSLLQLLRRDHSSQLILPECLIKDWPDLQLRFVHWDTKHHQKRMETMKRLIDWHAFFKINMIALEIEDKYEYPRHPVIGAPGAYTKAEMHELTEYALERHIQIVPDIQAPAHMAYVLKHEEFAHLKADTASNYQSCLCDPEAINLIFDLYQDMIDATPGVDYFLVSTDEIYYAGICDKCSKPYNPENRSLAWVEFAVKAHDWLAKRGRKMIAWVEYPLHAEDIVLLPPDLINGVMGRDKEFIEMQKKIGMRQLAYSPIQGSERLFSNYFSGNFMNIPYVIREGIANGANPVGSFAAAWDDSGLHEEVFHLGWVTVNQYAWNIYGPTIEQTVADFMDVFYGYGNSDIISIYKSLIEGAQFYSGGWDRITSKERGPSWGNSYGKGIGTHRSDHLLFLPELTGELTAQSDFKFIENHKELIDKAETLKFKNDDLIQKLTHYAGKVDRNRYNLEVFLSIAYLEAYFIKTVLTFRDVELLMKKAGSFSDSGEAIKALANLVEASNLVGSLISWADWMWQNLVITWERSRFEKGRSVDGRDFVHIMDDVKDHLADRRKGLDYLIAEFERTDIKGWRQSLNKFITNYARHNNIPVKGLEEVRLED